MHPGCGTCYGANYLRTGNPAKRDLDMCKIMRIRTLVSAYYHSKRIEKSLLSHQDYDDEDINSIRYQVDGIKKVLTASSEWDDLPIDQ